MKEGKIEARKYMVGLELKYDVRWSRPIAIVDLIKVHEFGADLFFLHAKPLPRQNLYSRRTRVISTRWIFWPFYYAWDWVCAEVLLLRWAFYQWLDAHHMLITPQGCVPKITDIRPFGWIKARKS